MIEQGKLAKAIEGLDACLEGLCEACSYRDVDAPGGCKDALMYDAFALLKAQEPVAVIPAIKKDNELLREGNCPACGMKLDWFYNGNYCGCCGQAVKWE